MTIKLSVTVMSASFDSERRLSVETLIREVGVNWIANLTIDWQVISDWRGDGPWPTAKRCWRHGIEQLGTHHMILQDDITVCDDFLLGVHEVIRAYPESPICLYANRKICEKAKESDARWVRIPDGIWGPAVILPHPLIIPFLEWEHKHIKPEFKHDDSRLALWCVETGNKVMCPQPSLVQHKAAQKSLLGQSHPSKVARWFEKETPLRRDWQNGAVINGPNNIARGYYDYVVR